MIRALPTAGLLALFAMAPAGLCAQQVGDRHRITLFHEMRSTSDDGGRSSSRGTHEYLIEVLAVGPDGVERLYEVPGERGDEPSPDWHWPVRVWEDRQGVLSLLNRADMEARRDAWLAAANIPREACGTWYFTWNAFQVQCDPEEILETIEMLDIQPPDLREGAMLSHAAALAPAPLRKDAGAGETFRATFSLDPDIARRELARSDVIVAQLMGKPVTFEEAYAVRQGEPIRGTIEVVLEANAEGEVERRIETIETVRTDAEGVTKSSTATETTERIAI